MNLESLVDNRTPMAFRCTAVTDRHGYERLVVIAKMTWAVSTTGAVAIASPPSPVRFSDVPASATPGSSIRYPSDLCEEKSGTDIILVGTAHPPQGRAVTEMDVSLRVETGKRTIHKVVKVYGPRVFHKAMLGVAPGPAATLGPTPLVYENAYGGTDNTDPQRSVVEARNPIGRGFAKNRVALVGLPAPQIEDPRAPVASRAPAPAGFGPISQGWAPRIGYAGTYDEVWRKKRAPLRPVDFDVRFHNVAHPDLWSEQPLLGDEPVEVLGATSTQVWRFRLPLYAPVITFVIRGQAEERRTHLDTFLIDADEQKIELTYRASVPLPRKLDAIEKIIIMGEPSLAEPLIEDLAQRVLLRRSEAT